MYSGYASSILGQVDSLNSVLTNVDNLNFEGVWKSQAGEKLLTSLDDLTTKMNTECNNLTSFANAIKKIDKCIEIDEKITLLNAELALIDTSTEEGAEAAAEIQAQIEQLEQEKEKIKNEVKSAISGFGSVGTEYAISYSSAIGFDYICKIAELEALLKKCYTYEDGNVANLYSEIQANGLSGMDYINSQLDSILESYSGREATVNSVLMSIMLAAEKGVKYDYTNNGANMVSIPYNTNEQMVDGMDCCAYVSWAVNKGTADPFHWEGVDGFASMGEEIDISEAMPGDVIVNDKHVAIIVDNDVENGKVTIAEAGGMSSDVHLVTYDSNNLRGNSFSSGSYPKVVSLEDYYTGVESNM